MCPRDDPNEQWQRQKSQATGSSHAKARDRQEYNDVVTGVGESVPRVHAGQSRPARPGREQENERDSSGRSLQVIYPSVAAPESQESSSNPMLRHSPGMCQFRPCEDQRRRSAVIVRFVLLIKTFLLLELGDSPVMAAVGISEIGRRPLPSSYSGRTARCAASLMSTTLFSAGASSKPARPSASSLPTSQTYVIRRFPFAIVHTISSIL